jgi:hypothetical protein
VSPHHEEPPPCPSTSLRTRGEVDRCHRNAPLILSEVEGSGPDLGTSQFFLTLSAESPPPARHPGRIDNEIARRPHGIVNRADPLDKRRVRQPEPDALDMAQMKLCCDVLHYSERRRILRLSEIDAESLGHSGVRARRFLVVVIKIPDPLVRYRLRHRDTLRSPPGRPRRPDHHSVPHATTSGHYR